MALLDVVGLCAGYGDVPVLRGIDLSIPAGTITALIGANGAGKTTLLRAISGIIPAEAGTIRYDGHDIVGMPPQDIVENVGRNPPRHKAGRFRRHVCARRRHSHLICSE